jgi:hypothetical protein
MRLLQSDVRKRWPSNEVIAGAVAFSRRGSPDVGEFEDAVILKVFGDVPDD